MTEPAGNTLSLTGTAVSGRKGSATDQLYLVLSTELSAQPARHALAGTDLVTLGRGERGSAERGAEGATRRLAIRVADPWMSSAHATLTRVFDRWVLADAGSRNGTFRNGERVESVELVDGDAVELGRTFFLFRAGVPVEEEDPADVDAARLPVPAPGLATLVPALGREMRRLALVAASDVPVVVVGESGTGKELIAHAVHALSARTGAFVPVNCGALPESLVESELFGYRKGAFSGALEDRPGLVRSADRGTLFLDEIGDLAAPSQAALLRMLQEREVMPIGGTRPVAVDVRFVAATHRDLEGLVARGTFRPDLLARISGYVMRLPSLRERKEDLGLILASLLSHLGPDRAPARLHADAARALLRHDWPLNVRELEKCLATALVLAGDGPVLVEHLPPGLGDARRTAAGGPAPGADPGAPEPPLTESDRRLRDELIEALKANDGNISAVARAMGKARMQIQRWVKRFRLDPDRYRH